MQSQPLLARKADLEDRIKRAQRQLESAKTVLRQDVDDIDVSDSMFQLARESNVRVMELRTTGFTTDSLQSVPVTALPLSITVAGQVPDILQFISKLGSYSTGLVKNVSFLARKTDFSSTIQFNICSYRGN